MRKTLTYAAALLMVSISADAGHVIPGVGRDLTDGEYRLAWALMSAYALNNCYEGPARSVTRAELTSYARVIADIREEVARREPKIDQYLLSLDVLRRASHPFVERNPGGWICNYARVNVARVYYQLFPSRCTAVGGCRKLFDACATVESGNVSKYELCPDSEIEELARNNYLPVRP